MYLNTKCIVCVCVCPRAPVSRGSLISPPLLYERRGSEKAADVEAVTFLVAAGRARVKKHPAPERSPSGSTCTDPRTHASTSGAMLMNRLATDHTRYLICSLPLCLEPPEVQKSSKSTIKRADIWPQWLCYTLEIGCSKQCCELVN